MMLSSEKSNAKGLVWFPSHELFYDKSVETNLTFSMGKHYDPPIIMLSAKTDYKCPIPFKYFVTSHVEPPITFWEYIHASCPILLIKVIVFPDPIVGVISIVIDPKETAFESTSVYHQQMQHLMNITHIASEMKIPTHFVCIRNAETPSPARDLLGEISFLSNIKIFTYHSSELSQFSEDFVATVNPFGGN